jgi:hypothetical protein
VDYKFGSAWGGRCSIDPTGLYRVGLWKNIKRLWRMFYSHATMLGLSWKMVPGSDSGMMYGAES